MPTTLVQWARRKKPRDEAAALHSQPNATDPPYEILAPYLRAARVLVRRQDDDARTADLRALERCASRCARRQARACKGRWLYVQEWDLEQEVRARLHAIENRMRDDRFLFVKVVNWLKVFGIEPQYPSPWWERENPWLLCSFVPCGYDRNEFMWDFERHQSALVDRRWWRTRICPCGMPGSRSSGRWAI